MRSQETFVGLFFGPSPEIEDLEAVLAKVHPEDGREISTIQPLCCRELLFTETKILCSPSLDDKTKLVIIGQKSILHSEQFQRLLNKLGIKITLSVDLSQDLFQYCLYFTINQRLAPLWNKAGEYFVKGRDFLLDSSKMDAITFDVTINDRICFGLKAFNLKLPPCKVEHFSASSKAIEDFHVNTSAVISAAAIHDDLCYVLPSLKKGRLVGISHHLPKEGPFATHEELRKHWKVMYGYRLPAKETTFYNVSFYYIKSKLFTYPGCCIRSREPVVSPRCDQQAIFKAFLKDLHIRMPSICGTPLRLMPSPMYPVKTLHSASSEIRSSLTRETPQMPHCRPFESLPGRQTAIEGVNKGRNEPRLGVSMGADANQESPNVVSGSDAITAQESPPVSKGLTTTMTPEIHPQSTPASVSRPRLVPHFTASRRLKFNPSKSKMMHIAVPRPVLSSATRKNALPLCSINKPNQDKRNAPDQTGDSKILLSVKSSTHQAVVNNANSGVPLPVPLKRAMGRSQPQTEAKAQMVEVRPERVVRTAAVPSTSYCPTVSLTCFSGCSSATISNSSTGSVEITHQNPALVAKRLPATRPGFAWANGAVNSNFLEATNVLSDATVRKSINPGFAPINTVVSSNLERSTDIALDSFQRIATTTGRCSPFSPVERQANTTAEMVCRKRKADEATGTEEPHNRKPRSKPKVQDLDIRQLAYSNQLNKANTATLMDWSRKHGIVVKSKDKKGDMMDKIKLFFGLTQSELPTIYHP